MTEVTKENKAEKLEFYIAPVPEPEWKCYLYGSKNVVYIPEKGTVPNFIVRYAMRLLGCRWVKNKKDAS